MIKESILQLNSGVCSLGSITVHRGRPNTGRFVCRAGEKTLTAFFILYKAVLTFKAKTAPCRPTPARCFTCRPA